VLPRLRISLVGIAVLGLAVRIAYVFANHNTPVQGDARAYHLLGAQLAAGEGFHRIGAPSTPTAEYPPMHQLLVALTDLLGLHSTQGQKLFFALAGTVTVVLIALLARAVTRRDGVAIAAGLMAATYPMLWMPDGALMAETTYGMFLTAALLAAVAYVRRPALVRVALFGGLLALAALSRAEATALLLFLLVPLAVRTRASWRGRVAVWVVGLAGFLVVIAPWQARLLTTFERPVFISNNGNGIWIGANCHSSYYTPLIGAWQFGCYGNQHLSGDESEQFAVYRRQGLEYARDNAGRVPVVVAARLGRVLDVYRPWGQGVALAAAEGRDPRASRLGLIAYWLLVPFAFAGAVLLRRRREPALVVLVAPVAMVVIVAMVTYGSTRFRFAAEPGLVVLGAVSVEALVRSLRLRIRPARSTATSVSAGISQSQSMSA
jgi:4-amino-4-deoxy-L-arabinose transferase-like glycosyltransferase